MVVAQHVHNHGHRIRCANVAVSMWIDVDDLQAQPWSINYYIDPAQAAERAARDLARAGGEPDEY